MEQACRHRGGHQEGRDVEVSANITKEDVDQLYHLLRKFSNSGDEFIEPAKSIFTHIFYGPAYENLLAYSEFYGQRYLLPKVIDLIHKFHWEDKFKRVVDLGCGRGWLGYGVAHRFNKWPVLVDKRSNVSAPLQDRTMFYCLNLETGKDLRYLKAVLEPKDLIVMSDYLHCIENPKQLLGVLESHSMIILEYTSSGNYSWLSSYYHQLKRYGATAFSSEQLTRIVREATGRVPKAVVMDPYLMMVVEGGECSSEAG